MIKPIILLPISAMATYFTLSNGTIELDNDENTLELARIVFSMKSMPTVMFNFFAISNLLIPLSVAQTTSYVIFRIGFKMKRHRNERIVLLLVRTVK